MVDIKFTTNHLLDQEANCLVFFLEQDFKFSKTLQECSDCFFPQLKTLMKERNFTGKALSSLLIPVALEKEVTNLLFIGLGKPAREQKTIDIENLRRAVGKMIRISETNKFATLSFDLPSKSLFGVKSEDLAQQIVVAADMACYQFDKFISDKNSRLMHDFTLTMVVPAKDKKVIASGIKNGKVIAESVNNARTWIDTPASDMTPTHMAKNAQAIAKKHGLKITIFDGKKVKELGMGGMEAVSRGSDQDCRFVVMEYRVKKSVSAKATSDKAPTIGLVGKGITFDSGGLSLKPAKYMESMKEDMSGSATVIATMEALAQLKPSVNVVAVAALAENMPGSKAFKPGDVLTFYNGKTAEILNTDAEGRLVLADALSYVTEKFKLDALVDVATLTGACLYALGPFFCGLMSQHDELIKKMQKASENSGDRVWALPFHDDYKPAIKSKIADIKNVGDSRYMAGTMTAGFFLQNFVGDTPWLHLDIAGTAFNVPDISYYRSGATGFGVRLLVEFVKNWK